MADITSEGDDQNRETPDNDRPLSADRRHNVNLRNLFLDPNNYRFIDSEAFTRVKVEDDYTRDDVQRRTMNLILGKNGENVKDLLDSFRKSGFLPVDQIQVRQLGSGKYLVVEGNRRVAALKFLQRRYDSDGFDLANLDPNVFTRVPVVSYQDAGDAHHLVLMGLKHISGNKKWPAINQAELVRDLTEKFQMSATDICESISISRREYNTTLSTLRLIDQYKNSDYGDQFKTDMYSIFREITRNAAVRNWLGWSEQSGTCSNPQNLERLFSWLSLDEQRDDQDLDDDAESIGGFRLEPVLTKATHIRELARLVGDETALKNLDNTRSLTQASLSSELLGKNRVANSVSLIGQELTTVFSMSTHLSDTDRLDLKNFGAKLNAILDVGGGVEPAIAPTSLVAQNGVQHFTSFHIERYRRLTNVFLDGLTRINILAGINNSGKTSVLEVIDLASNLNNFKSQLEVISRRAKASYEVIRSDWLMEQTQEWAAVGKIGEKILTISSQNYIEDVPDQAFYLGTIETKATLAEQDFGSITQVFDRYPYKTVGNTKALLPTQFSSPYAPRKQSDLIEAYGIAVKCGLKDEIIEFIQNNVDMGFEDVELIRDRFWVKKTDGGPGYLDIANFGEGVQRIFAICVLFASAKGGVLFMDEAESGIHNTLFEKFALFIHKLSVDFDVQVFMSTHSKECIDAFVNVDGLPPADITGYAVVSEGSSIRLVRIDGPRLSELVSSIDFDMRGVRG